MRFDSPRFRIAIAALFIVAIACSIDSGSVAHAGLCLEPELDDFSDGVLDPRFILFTTCGSVTESDGELVLDGNCSTNTRYRLDPAQATICGDFDVRVSYDLISFPAPMAGSSRFVTLTIRRASDLVHMASMERFANNGAPVPPEAYKAWTTDPVFPAPDYIATSDTSGRFRITRIGATLSMYYFDSDWQLLRSEAGDTGDVIVELRTSSEDGALTAAAYDNLELITPRTVLQFEFEGTPGAFPSTISDSSLNELDGTVAGGDDPFLVADDPAYGFTSLDFTNDRITFPDFPQLDDLDRFTVEAIVMPRNLPPAEAGAVITNWGFGSNEQFFFGVSSGGEFQFKTFGQTETQDRSVFAPIPLANRWYHVAGVRDFGAMRIYVGGVEIDTNSVADMNSHCEYLSIGSRENDDTFFDGRIAAIRLSDEPLTPDEFLLPLPSDEFIRGDVDGDTAVQLPDAIAILDYLFNSGSVTCLDALDVNDNDAITITDAFHILCSLFCVPAGPAPEAPYPACGSDPTLDAIACDSFASCP